MEVEVEVEVAELLDVLEEELDVNLAPPSRARETLDAPITGFASILEVDVFIFLGGIVVFSV